MFNTPDGFITLTVADDEQWRGLAELMGKPEMARDPRYIDALRRHQARHELKAAIEQWMAGFGSREELMVALRDRGIAAMPIYRLDEVANHPHLAARRTFVTLEAAPFGPTQFPVLPFRYSGAEIAIDTKCSLIGADNNDVLRRYLNYSPGQVDELLRQEVLFEHPGLAARRDPPRQAAAQKIS
jgi:crotonobetainyl-CoA:carnitine CoA-transferase CaiB-like acyl-CoA transferase